MFKRKKEKDIHEECWNLDATFIRWLNEHLKVFREDASKCIDMGYHKFEYDGETVPFKDLLDKLIDLTDEFIKVQDENWLDESLDDLKEDIMSIFNTIFWCLWW